MFYEEGWLFKFADSAMSREDVKGVVEAFDFAEKMVEEGNRRLEIRDNRIEKRILFKILDSIGEHEGTIFHREWDLPEEKTEELRREYEQWREESE